VQGVCALALEINESRLPQKNISKQIRIYFLVTIVSLSVSATNRMFIALAVKVAVSRFVVPGAS